MAKQSFKKLDIFQKAEFLRTSTGCERLSPRDFSRYAAYQWGAIVPWFFSVDEPPLPFAHSVNGHPYHSRAECLDLLAVEDDDFDPSLYPIDDDERDLVQDQVMRRDEVPARTGETVCLQGFVPYQISSTPKENTKAETDAEYTSWVFDPGALVVEDDVTLVEGHNGTRALASTADGTLRLDQMPHGLIFEAVIDRDTMPAILSARREMSVSPMWKTIESTWHRQSDQCATQQIHRARLIHIALVEVAAFSTAYCYLR
jgi:hypothetical protein